MSAFSAFKLTTISHEQWLCIPNVYFVQITTKIKETFAQVFPLFGQLCVQYLDTPTHSRVFPYFYYLLNCRIIVKTSKL
jgi:hypothetical protein